MWFYMKNQEQVGPLDWEQLTAAAREGRLLPNDAVWTQGMPQWQAAGSVAGLFAMQTQQAFAYGSQGYVVPPSQNNTDPLLRMALPIGRSWWAIAAGYFGLFSLIILPAPIALLLGIAALADIRRHPEKLGKGRAIFGVIMGLLGTGILIAGLVAAGMHR